MKINKLPYELTVIPTLGDGDCLIHAILGCTNSLYKKSDKKAKRLLARQLRNDLADLLDVEINNTTFYQKLSRGQAAEISKYIIELKKENMQKMLRSSAWLTATFIELLSMVFDINIVIISEREKDIYRLADKELFFQYRSTIFINYIDNTHYESIGIQTKDGLKTIFHRDNEIVKHLNKII